MTISAHRKVVTVLFCDVVGSTALGESVDPEALQGLLARYFERMKAIVESHGGSVEKFIGDAVMAVFGVPVAHEDDALRACRAAVEMRDALPELGVAGRIGVNTGEVLTGTEERLATGDAVNVAARLEQAAEAGQVLIGGETLALVDSAVEVGGERLLELKGKSEPVAAHPLVAILEAPARSHVSRFVGRERELQHLLDTWDRAFSGPCCELLTVVGDPGVGKSRLVTEALDRIEARVVRGRCLSYGEGITYWPVVETVKQLAALPSDEQAASAIRSLLGEDVAVAGTDEIAWAFRKLLEEQAPLVVCFDDIQWGDETFLDLVESTALLSTGAPILLLCMARPELLDRRAGWTATLRLQPLGSEDTDALVGEAVPEEVRERIVRASGGNPLFVTEMLALASDGDDIEVPATLRALLAARLDQLEEPERRVLERGAVEGELFHRGTVQVLTPEETEVIPRLAALVRRDLVRPDRPQLPREDAYRFRHLLIRDAAYDALPKATRAVLHRRFAEWLEQRGESLVELDEILGYHLEQAARYLDELGRPDQELAIGAGERLARAGRLAAVRGPLLAVTLLERGLNLLRPFRLDIHLEAALVMTLLEVDAGRAVTVAGAARERAEAIGDEADAALARTLSGTVRMHAGDCSTEELEGFARTALPLLEAVGDDDGLVRVWEAFLLVASTRCRFEDMARAAEHALSHRRRSGFPVSYLFTLPVALVMGPRHAGEALATLDSLLPDRPDPGTMMRRASLLAMLGRIDEAWSVALPADEKARELGIKYGNAFLGDIALIIGDYEAAADYLGRACEEMEARGAIAQLSSYAPGLGRVLSLLGRADEAEPLIRRGLELGAPEDVLTQANCCQGQALIYSAREQHGEAERLAREALDWLAGTDALLTQSWACGDLARVLEASGRRDEAAAAWREALDRSERKGVAPLSRIIRERLAAFPETPSSRDRDGAVP